jgi:hypothetical protein
MVTIMRRMILVLALMLGSANADQGPLFTYTITPCRLLDTRTHGGAYRGIEERYYFAQGSPVCPIPLGAKGLLFTIAAVDPTVDGVLLVDSSDLATDPVVATLNFKAGPGATSSSGVTELGQNVRYDFYPDLAIHAYVPGGQVQVVLDVVGYLK